MLYARFLAFDLSVPAPGGPSPHDRSGQDARHCLDIFDVFTAKPDIGRCDPGVRPAGQLTIDSIRFQFEHLRHFPDGKNSSSMGLIVAVVSPPNGSKV